MIKNKVKVDLQSVPQQKLNINFFLTTIALAQIGMESFLTKQLSFTCWDKATEGSS